MTYDRKKAIAYAQKYWTAPCEDGLLGAAYGHPAIEHFRKKLHAPAPAWEGLFVRDDGGTESGIFRKSGEKDIVFETQDALDDCAHYLSQCVRAGGARIDTQWGVRFLIESLQGLPDTKTLMERGSFAAGGRIIQSGLFKEGDMIGYFHNSAGKEFGYGHSAMYVGNGGITCHSTCRYKSLGDSSDDEWDLDQKDYTYTFIHFSAGDAMDAGLAKAVKGWWKVEYGGRVNYYYLFEDGRARKSATAPRNWNDALQGGPAAYWFVVNNSIRFTWTATGELEEWVISRPNTVSKAKLNDTAGTATKQPHGVSKL
ncbi:MAG TPA: hypothetical protein VGL97_14050 [Bryobacteraceae bacterium]|jgi:hypothetical protein